MSDQQLPLDLSPILNARISFGLQAQGHVPTIERMLSDGASWEQVGAAIGWHPATVKEHWERLQQLKIKKFNDLIERRIFAVGEPITDDSPFK